MHVFQPLFMISVSSSVSS